MDSPGPVLFRQERYERADVFLLWKFPTMTVPEANGPFPQARASDQRFTRVGKFLRRASLDKLPQPLNVLQSDMSLRGPRPHALATDDAYARFVSRYSDRHLVRPGMTGLAQDAGHRGPTPARQALKGKGCATIASTFDAGLFGWISRFWPALLTACFTRMPYESRAEA